VWRELLPARTLDELDALMQGEHEVEELLSVEVFRARLPQIEV